MVFRAFDGTVPQHFYGEMSKTELGCQVLQEKGHFNDFAHFIKQHGRESEDTDLIMKLKSILWTVVCFFWHFYSSLIYGFTGKCWCNGGRSSISRRRDDPLYPRN